MASRVERLRIGPYRLSKSLGAGTLAERWVAVHETDHSVHVAHRFRVTDDTPAEPVLEAVAAVSRVSHPHLLPIEEVRTGIAGSVWVITPFTGNHDGLVSLESLLAQKGGRLSPLEADRALTHLLEASSQAHAEGCHHGPISPAEVLVDRRGSLAIELYGVRRRLTPLWERTATEVARDEVRSIVEIGYLLITGLPADEPRIAATRLFPRLDSRWDDWFNEGLDPLGGFGSADEAMAWLPSLRREIEGARKTSPVHTVIRRVREALRQA